MRALLLAVLLVAPFAMAGHSESRTFAGPTHTTSSRFSSCAVPAPFAINGACFALDGSETRVRIDIAEASGLPIPTHVFFERPGNGGGDVFTCDAVIDTAVPEGMSVMRVWFPPDDTALQGAPYCPLAHGVATAGTIDALFT